MIVILSRKDDGSTGMVTEWLSSLGKPFIRINADDNLTKFVSYNISAGKLIVRQGEQEYNLLDAKAVWYRRKGFSAKSININSQDLKDPVFMDHNSYHIAHVEQEIRILIDYLYYSLEKKGATLGSYQNASPNKMIVLDIAKKAGFSVPESYILTSRKDIVALCDDKQSLVTKALSDGVYLFTKKYGYYSYTEKISEDNLDDLPERFFPSLLQKEIRKKYELRVFFIKEAFYAMAIFSQNDKQTAVDFRKYNTDKPNRMVPFNLPEHVREKISVFMQELGLNTGSIDIIVDENDDYVLLEVNPVGQFVMTSAPCNYHLDYKIASML